MRVSAWILLAWFIAAIIISRAPVVAQASTDRTDAPATSISGNSEEPDKKKTIRVYMPDGQLKSHSVRVYVKENIYLWQNPKLELLRNNAQSSIGETTAKFVAPNQEWIEVIDGQNITEKGTLMLFDINSMRFGCKSMTRVTPVVSWNDGKRIAIGAREVNVGNITAAVLWTIFFVGLVLATLIRLSHNKPLLFLSGADGHLSLAKTQVACWTVAVGFVVLSYGLIRLDIPNIPQSLLALMGASLVTGGVASFQDDKQAESKTGSGSSRLRDLVRAHAADGHISLAKAQMLFWTVLLLLLFVTKSLLDGSIWEVPWELVALMGFSQAGYLAPKLQNGGNQNGNPHKDNERKAESSSSPTS